ncbi:uncharacterized protein BYT42DRAFT_573276 [Radiomyces spectabilis]|uniref:uncharacterized protein n=1 Tax=Radiomyces spectabilis TaxID=64574 RepID=UPI00221ECE62|nr:uncharacterized protein BYT42DRAFT_573276 [Radiomyces spectabilis]KAI8376056.1 hypothetical protein BYT42DRAFT_573276 [Radiomyces spectabilis]
MSQRCGLHGRSFTLSDFYAKKGYHPMGMTFGRFPFTQADLTDKQALSSNTMMRKYPTEDLFDQELINNNQDFSSLPAKKVLSKAERRAEHNAIERARRETLNSKFHQLALALPNLQSYRRPSKSVIVEKALDWVKQSLSKEERYRYQIIQLQQENKRLLAELLAHEENQAQLGKATHSGSPTPQEASLSTPSLPYNNWLAMTSYPLMDDLMMKPDLLENPMDKRKTHLLESKADFQPSEKDYYRMPEESSLTDPLVPDLYSFPLRNNDNAFMDTTSGWSTVPTNSISCQ